MRTPLLTLASLLIAACSGTPGQATGGGAAGIQTKIDSTGDTVTATLSGDVPGAAVRHLVEEISIAPGAEDTTLFTDVYEFDVDAHDRTWVFDRASSSLLLFAPDGKLIKRAGRRGAGPGEYGTSSGMVILPNNSLAFWDSRNARISFVDSTGTFQTSWTVPGGFSTSNGLVTDRQGELYLRRPVTPPRETEILGRMGLVRLGPSGVFRDSLIPPDLAVPREVYLAVSKDGNSRSSTSSPYAPNYYWTWHPNGYFVVAHGGRYEIIVARKNAKPVVIRRSLPPVRVDPDERTIQERSITYNMRQTEPTWSWKGPPLPETKAPLQSLFAARDGRIWARVAVPSELIPESEIVASRDSLQPVTRHRSPVVYEVFQPSGEFLGRIAFPPRTTLMEADGDKVWAIARDADDIPAVVRYHIEPRLQ